MLTPVAFCKMSIGFKTTGLNTSTPNLLVVKALLLFSSPVEQNYQLKTWNAANFPSSAVSQRHSDCDTLATLLLFFFEGPLIQCTCIILFLSVLPHSTSIKPQPNRVRSSCCIRTLKFPEVIMALFCILSVGGRTRGAGRCEGVYTCGVKS